MQATQAASQIPVTVVRLDDGSLVLSVTVNGQVCETNCDTTEQGKQELADWLNLDAASLYLTFAE